MTSKDTRNRPSKNSIPKIVVIVLDEIDTHPCDERRSEPVVLDGMKFGRRKRGHSSRRGRQEMTTDESRKRRQYAIAEVEAVVAAVPKVGVVEAARRHGVPQTTVSNWIHRDAAKVAARIAMARAGAAKMESTRKIARATRRDVALLALIALATAT